VRAQKAKIIIDEIFSFIKVNIVMLTFSVALLFRRLFLPNVNCEISLIVFIIYFSSQAGYEMMQFKKNVTFIRLIVDRTNRRKLYIRRIKNILENLLTAALFLLMMIFTVKKEDG
jgi:glucose-6-phosphate-specific signal transduction histidine kinase